MSLFFLLTAQLTYESTSSGTWSSSHSTSPPPPSSHENTLVSPPRFSGSQRKAYGCSKAFSLNFWARARFYLGFGLLVCCFSWRIHGFWELLSRMLGGDGLLHIENRHSRYNQESDIMEETFKLVNLFESSLLVKWESCVSLNSVCFSLTKALDLACQISLIHIFYWWSKHLYFPQYYQVSGKDLNEFQSWNNGSRRMTRSLTQYPSSTSTYLKLQLP